MSSAQRSFSFQMPHICLLWPLSGWYHVVWSRNWSILQRPAPLPGRRSLLTLSYTPSPQDFSPSCHRLESSLAARLWVHECVSPQCELYWEPGGAAARVVVCYMDSLSEPTEGPVPVKESSRGHCGRTPVTYETRGALWIMHKRDCFCHENVGFGPDVRMILL